MVFTLQTKHGILFCIYLGINPVNMFDDDFLDDDYNSMEDLLARFEEVKKGESSSIMEEE